MVKSVVRTSITSEELYQTVIFPLISAVQPHWAGFYWHISPNTGGEGNNLCWLASDWNKQIHHPQEQDFTVLPNQTSPPQISLPVRHVYLCLEKLSSLFSYTPEESGSLTWCKQRNTEDDFEICTSNQVIKFSPHTSFRSADSSTEVRRRLRKTQHYIFALNAKTYPKILLLTSVTETLPVSTSQEHQNN